MMTSLPPSQVLCPPSSVFLAFTIGRSTFTVSPSYRRTVVPSYRRTVVPVCLRPKDGQKTRFQRKFVEQILLVEGGVIDLTGDDIDLTRMDIDLTLHDICR